MYKPSIGYIMVLFLGTVQSPNILQIGNAVTQKYILTTL